MNKLTFVALATLLGSAGAFAASRAQQTFMTSAIQGDLAEIQAGKLAQQKGTNEQVKSFGQMLVNDHQADEQKASQVANQVGVNPPTEPSRQQRSDYDRLSSLSGPAFDRQFASMMVADHRKTINNYRRQSRMKDSVGQYAKQSLPTLEKHLRAAERLERSGRSAGR